jgi:hypothetical protein
VTASWAEHEWERLQTAASENDLTPDILDRILILDRGLINTAEGRALDNADTPEAAIVQWFVHMSNHLDREAGRRPPIDIDIYTRSPRWTPLR